MKVKELFEMWLDKYVKPSVKIRTYNKYESVVNSYIIPVIGELKLSECTLKYPLILNLTTQI